MYEEALKWKLAFGLKYHKIMAAHRESNQRRNETLKDSPRVHGDVEL